MDILPFGGKLKAIPKICKQCQEHFLAGRKDKVFCTAACKKQHIGSLYRSKNKDKLTEYGKEYRKDSSNAERQRCLSKQFRLKNSDLLKQKKRIWQEEFRQTHGVSYATFRRRNSLNERIKHNIRVRINKAVNGVNKTGSAVIELGCSIEDFKTHIQTKFSPGMSWTNYGEWHIDHIIPLNSFDLVDPEQFRRACHYTNLTPLWAEDNLMKGKKNPFV